MSKKMVGIWWAALVWLAIGLGVGGMAFRSHQLSNSIRAELAAAEAQAPVQSFLDSYRYGRIPDPGRADRERLRSELFASSYEAETWTLSLAIYLGLTLGAGLLLLAVSAAWKLLRWLRKNAHPARLAPKLSSAAHAFTNSMPRRPTIGGGRQSTADELRKWASLRDDGLISQEEFAQMREKLLGPEANA